MDSKHILFISYDGMTDPLGQSQVIPYLTSLTNYGYRFTILSCDKPGLYAKGKEYVLELIRPYPVKWISVPYHRNPPVLSSVYDYWKLRKVALKLFRKDPFVMVHTRPGVPSLIGMWLKKKLGVKFLNDVRGFWADERVDGGMWNLKNPLYRRIYNFFKKHEFECLEKADYTTCVTEKARKEMQSWKNIPNQPIRIEVIPCSVDMVLFNPEAIDPQLMNKFKKELGIDGSGIIISYLGSIGGWYLTEEMMQCCKVISTRIPDARFLFISPHRHEIILSAADKREIPRDRIIIVKGKRHEIPSLLSFSDYSLFFIKPAYSKISSSPTKHGEIMAMGIPVITNEGVGDVSDIVEKYHGGYVIPELTEKNYQQVAESIAVRHLFDKDEIRKGAEEFYSLEIAIKKYLLVYNSIT